MEYDAWSIYKKPFSRVHKSLYYLYCVMSLIVIDYDVIVITCSSVLYTLACMC